MGARFFMLGKAFVLSGLIVLLFPGHAACDWKEVDEILSEAYGPEVARECQDYYHSVDVPQDQVNSVRDAVVRLVEAGYPDGCPRDYLRMVAELAGAGINLQDLTNKIREGVAKKVNPERLVRVMEQRTEALKRARVLALELEGEGFVFLDRQMAYTVVADYLLRGVSPEDLRTGIVEGSLAKFPALENVLR